MHNTGKEQMNWVEAGLHMRAPFIRRIIALMAAVAVGALLLPLSAAAAELGSANGDDWLTEEEEFLKVDEAFRLTTSINAKGDLYANWQMPDGYYLYRHQFEFEARNGEVTLGDASIPQGKPKVDDWFGEVEVYYHQAEAVVPLTGLGTSNVEIGVSYQGCADAGLCYPPETKWFVYDGSQVVSTAEFAAAVPESRTGSQASTVSNDETSQADAGSAVPSTEEQQLAGVLASENLLIALAVFFIAGVGLAFTPCVFPMVPILSTIIVGEGEGISKGRAFSLSLAYVLGMAITYAIVGTLVGLFGAELNLQAALQSTPVLVFFAIVFVLLSLSMFGFYELQLPQSWQNKLNEVSQKQQGGKHPSVFVMGSLSSLVVSPCVSAPLAGALIYISNSGDAVLGGTALLALGLGMGVPLMVVGGTGGHWLPRAGAWMDGVKAVFGVLLLGVAIWLVERIIPASATMALWAALLLGTAVYLGVLDFSPKQGIAQFGKAVGAMGFLWGVLLMIGAASGAEDPLKPLARLTASGAGAEASRPAEQEWVAVKSLADVQAKIAASDRPVILDLYADWCISCKVMERSVFPVERVAEKLAQFTLLRADVTENDETDRALLSYYGLFGPPSLVFFAADGSELSEVRIQGEVGADALSTHLGAVLATYRAENVGELAGISR
jgi:thiol:disulfide interchange protein DsbD